MYLFLLSYFPFIQIIHIVLFLSIKLELLHQILNTIETRVQRGPHQDLDFLVLGKVFGLLYIERALT